MKKNLIIVGAGEHAHVAANILKTQFTILGYLDDDPKKENVIGPIADYKKHITNRIFFIGIGHNLFRAKIFREMQNTGAVFTNTIHDYAYIEADAKIGENVFIGAFSYINVGSKIGNNTIINNGCIVEHDNTIGSHVHLTPGVTTGGGVTIDDYTFIGLGTTINDHLTIGSNNIIGSGAAVTKELGSNNVAVGVPAKIIKENDQKPD